MVSELYRSSPVQRPRLRIGVLLDGLVCNRIFAAVMEDIQASDFARIDLAVIHAPDEAGPAAPRWQRRLKQLTDPKKRSLLLYHLYQKLDSRRIPEDASPISQVSCEGLLSDAARMIVKPQVKGFVHRFAQDDVEEIRKHDLDVILRFGFNILRGDILQAARYGIWSYHHGDNDYYRGGPPLFWEIVENNPESGVILQQLNEELDAGLVLCKAVLATELGIWSSDNRFGPYWAARHFVIQKLWELHQHGWDYLLARATRGSEYRGRNKIYRAPTNAEMARWMGPKILSKARRLVKREASIPHWKVAVRSGATTLLESASTGEPKVDDFGWIESPKGHFYADPCLFHHEGQTWLFAEDYDYSRKKGVIGFTALNEGILPDRLETCLDEAFHLSYPLVFADEGRIHMIPEAHSSGQVLLYSAEDFPRRWKREAVLANLPAVDVTPWFDGRLWWFFVTVCEPLGHCPMLLLFSSQRLGGRWRYHPANPLSRHVSNVRNGGPIFEHAGKLFRPSQDGRVNYGRSFTLNEIVRLTEDEYEESPVVSVEPWLRHMIGTHTYTSATGWEAIDGCFRLPAHEVLG